MVLELERIAAVLTSGSQGSGVLLSNRLVLTARHVVGEERHVQAAVRAGLGWVRCDVLGRMDDIALLEATSPLVAAPLRRLRMAVMRDLQPLPGCHAMGYPDVGRDRLQRLAGHQLTGTLKPGPGQIRDRRLFESSHPAPRSGSPWAGLSGAGVFHGDILVGLITADHEPDRWRHTQLDVQSFADLLQDHELGQAVATAVDVAEPPTLSEHELFEARYRESLHAQHGRIRIFGLDLDDRVRTEVNRMELDTAYLSLSAHEKYKSGMHQHPEKSTGRVETMLAERPRTLLRGAAGSGKTTLVQWLALHATELPGFEERVPFVLKLRSLTVLPRPGEFLAASRSNLAESEPPGWADTVLRAGRGLLLVDGVDEIPEDRRAGTREWLSDLLRHYPGTAAVVTGRPSAVLAGWLAADGFQELSLLPMTAEEQQTFIKIWHEAAGTSTELGDALLRTLQASPTLASLTDSPLLCAMICALHRNRNGALPNGRMEVYRAALSMLLARRDEERQVATELSEDDHLALLQALAHWLVKEGRVEAEHSAAINQIRRAKESLGPAARAKTPEVLYRYALERSGLLYEPSADGFEFIHKTFQDYLAAKEFAEDWSFNSLLSHVGDEQWVDVIRMTVGHCRPKDRGVILKRLVDDPRASATLSASCLPYATRLEPEVRELVLDSLKPLLLTARLPELACAGDDAIDLLPPEIWRDNPGGCAELLGAVGSPAALAALADGVGRCAHHHLTAQWPRFDTRLFAETLLARIPLSELRLQIYEVAQLREAIRLGPVAGISLRHLPAAALEEYPVDPGVAAISLEWLPDLTSLEFLAGHENLSALSIRDCPRLSDLSQLSRLRPRQLTLHGLNSVTAAHLVDVVSALDSVTKAFLGPGELLALKGKTLPANACAISGYASWEDDESGLRNIAELLRHNQLAVE